jgi:hypothetical protein
MERQDGLGAGKMHVAKPVKEKRGLFVPKSLSDPATGF